MGAFIDLTGLTFGYLEVIDRGPTLGSPPGTQPHWNCRCACGELKLVCGAHLRGGLVVSCGRCRKQTHRMTHAPEYWVWAAMLQRVNNPANCNYPRYGGRGIKVCERWLSFENFYADMGQRPSPKHSIERLRNDGDYAPANCKWATKAEQVRNMRRNFMITAFGKTQCVSDWWRETGLPLTTITGRIRRGIEPEIALTLPGRKQRKGA